MKIDNKMMPFYMMIFIMLIGFTSFAIRCHRAEKEVNSLQIDLKYSDSLMMSTNEQLDQITEELNIANTTIEDLKNSSYKLVYLGDFKLTHYCTEKYEHICGTGTGITASGTHVTSGRTVAVDPNVIPYGTELYIEGYGWRVAEDCGGAVKESHIDIAVESHELAISLGTQYGGIWILVK